MQIKNRMFRINVDIFNIKGKEKKEIQDKIKQNTKNISDYEKKKEAILISESTTNIIPQKKAEIYSNDNQKQNDPINELINEQKYEEEKSYSTDHNQSTENSKFKTKYPIDIKGLKEEKEHIINEKIKDIKDPTLSYYQKRKKVLQESKTEKHDIRDKQYFLEIQKIKEVDENRINEKINNNKNLIQNYYEKRQIVIKDDESTTDYVKKTDISNSSGNAYNQVNDSSFIGNQSTRDSSQIDNSQINNESNENNQIIQKETEKKFNLPRSNFYIKNKLYDCPYYEQELNKIIPEKYKINEKGNMFGFLYPDGYKTYYITKSRYLGEDKIINELNDKEINLTNFDNSRGLCFCGKEIKINEKETKICCPNEFICKECMKINKKKYNINDKYLININGRVAKINKGSYHCFGHFLGGIKSNQIEDCISKFSCKACKLLDDFKDYYN